MWGAEDYDNESAFDVKGTVNGTCCLKLRVSKVIVGPTYNHINKYIM